MSKHNPSAAATMQPTPATPGTVTSQDATAIHYLTVGTTAPGLLILHGAMESAPSHLHLAQTLSSTYTIYLPSRRGRLPSGPHGEDYTMQTEVADLTALLAKTGAKYVMGVSSGALIVLRAAQLGFPGTTEVEKIILFEPPLINVSNADRGWVSRYDAEIAANNPTAALVTGMLGAKMGPPFLRYFPRWMLLWLAELMMSREDAAMAGVPTEEEKMKVPVGMRELAPTLHYDAQLVHEMDIQGGSLEGCKSISTEVLLLGGTSSPAYLQDGVNRLEGVIVGARRVRLKGMHHGATGNKDRGGQPEKVAEVLREFLG